jgi:hypothetical protein
MTLSLLCFLGSATVRSKISDLVCLIKQHWCRFLACSARTTSCFAESTYYVIAAHGNPDRHGGTFPYEGCKKFPAKMKEWMNSIQNFVFLGTYQMGEFSRQA